MECLGDLGKGDGDQFVDTPARIWDIRCCTTGIDLAIPDGDAGSVDLATPDGDAGSIDLVTPDGDAGKPCVGKPAMLLMRLDGPMELRRRTGAGAGAVAAVGSTGTDCAATARLFGAAAAAAFCCGSPGTLGGGGNNNGSLEQLLSWSDSPPWAPSSSSFTTSNVEARGRLGQADVIPP